MKKQSSKKAQPSSDQTGRGAKETDRRQAARRGVDDVFYVWYPSYDERDGERRKA